MERQDLKSTAAERAPLSKTLCNCCFQLPFSIADSTMCAFRGSALSCSLWNDICIDKRTRGLHWKREVKSRCAAIQGNQIFAKNLTLLTTSIQELQTAYDAIASRMGAFKPFKA